MENFASNSRSSNRLWESGGVARGCIRHLPEPAMRTDDEITVYTTIGGILSKRPADGTAQPASTA